MAAKSVQFHKFNKNVVRIDNFVNHNRNMHNTTGPTPTPPQISDIRYQISDISTVPVDRGSEKIRTKTSQRLKYEAETQVFKREMGSLEEIRIKLGFSKRKICQLLLVDPSAWSRWTMEKSDAPPHIYRSLKWYLDSKSFQMGQVESTLTKVLSENADLKANVKSLQKQTRILSFILGVLIVSAGVLAIVGSLK